MADSWSISAAGKTYGPFSFEQMQSFVKEGRLAPHSLVARTGTQDFRSAAGDTGLSHLFPEMTGVAMPAAAVQPLHREEPIVRQAPRTDAKAAPERARFLILADMKSRSISGLEEEIFNLGPAYELFPQAWIVTTTLSINAVRNMLLQKLGKIDSLFIADTTHNKATWFNFGPEAEARIRRVWNPTAEPTEGR
jgi:hypothetical protein